MTIKKSDVKLPTLPEPRAVSVPELGGDVMVRPITLSERLSLGDQIRDHPNVNVIYPALLERAVVDADGLPLFTFAQWEAFGAQHTERALELFNAAFDLAGMNKDAAEKKSKAQSSSSP